VRTLLSIIARTHRRDAQVQAPSTCSTAGATVPFIAVIAGSDRDAPTTIQLRALEERLRYLREDG